MVGLFEKFGCLWSNYYMLGVYYIFFFYGFVDGGCCFSGLDEEI